MQPARPLAVNDTQSEEQLLVPWPHRTATHNSNIPCLTWLWPRPVSSSSRRPTLPAVAALHRPSTSASASRPASSSRCIPAGAARSGTLASRLCRTMAASAISVRGRVSSSPNRSKPRAAARPSRRARGSTVEPVGCSPRRHEISARSRTACISRHVLSCSLPMPLGARPPCCAVS